MAGGVAALLAVLPIFLAGVLLVGSRRGIAGCLLR